MSIDQFIPAGRKHQQEQQTKKQVTAPKGQSLRWRLRWRGRRGGRKIIRQPRSVRTSRFTCSFLRHQLSYVQLVVCREYPHAYRQQQGRANRKRGPSDTKTDLEEQAQHALLLPDRPPLGEHPPQLRLRCPLSLVVQMAAPPALLHEGFSKLGNAPVARLELAKAFVKSTKPGEWLNGCWRHDTLSPVSAGFSSMVCRRIGVHCYLIHSQFEPEETPKRVHSAANTTPKHSTPRPITRICPSPIPALQKLENSRAQCPPASSFLFEISARVCLPSALDHAVPSLFLPSQRVQPVERRVRQPLERLLLFEGVRKLHLK